MLLLARAAQQATARSCGAQQCVRARAAAVALRVSPSSRHHASFMSAAQRHILPSPLRGDRSWRARAFIARGPAQQRGGAAAHAASLASGAKDDDDAASAVDHAKAPRPRLFKYIAAFAVFGLAGNSFGALR
jgi:hypothetical protein